MRINDYQKEAMRTRPPKADIVNAALGLAGESGEFADIIKKALYHGHDFDRVHLGKELGDICWYIALAADILGYDLETIMQMNVDKLKARYPDGFDTERSKHRVEGDI